MSLMLALAAVAAGLWLLMRGGDWLVQGAITLAQRWGVGTLFIGIVIVGFGTSLPEMLATTSASLNGSPGLALGNIVGSNIANIGLILAVALLLMGHHTCKDDRADWLLMLGASVIFALLVFGLGALSRPVGVGLLFMLGGYLFLSLKLAQGKKALLDDDVESMNSLRSAIIAVLGGLVVLALGAELLVRGALVVATTLGVPEVVIGVALVAVGTSLPELAATIAAARQKQLGLVVGNVLGSNVFNVLGATGFSALVLPLPSADIRPDLLPMLIFALLPALLCWQTPLKGRLLGGLMLVGYVGYIGWRVLS